jgi:hypothetical protein
MLTAAESQAYWRKRALADAIRVFNERNRVPREREYFCWLYLFEWADLGGVEEDLKC